MSKVKVNYKSDLPPIEVTFKVNNVAVDVPDHDFSLRFFVEGCDASYYCGCKYTEVDNAEEDSDTLQAEYFHCAPTLDGSKLTCYINNHNFTPGRLRVEMIDLASNENYEDGIKKTVVPDTLDVYLVEGVGDEVDNVVADTFGYMVGKGILSVTKTGTVGVVDTYTITYDDGTTTTYTVTNGRDGVNLGDVAIADDLVANDSTKVLSAKQGYLLNQRLSRVETYELGTKTYDSDGLTKDYYYKTDVAVGSTVAGTLIATSSGYGCLKLDIKAGDKIVVAAKGGSSGRAYALTDTSNKVLVVATSGENTISSPVTLTATVDGYLYLNSSTDEQYIASFAVTHYHSQEHRLISQLNKDVEALSPEKKVDGIDVEAKSLAKASTATRYMKLPYKPTQGKRYLLTITSPSAITSGVVITANEGASATGAVVIASFASLSANTPKAVEVEFPDSNRTYIFSEAFLNLDITATIKVCKVMIDENNIKKGSTMAGKLSAISIKTKTGNLVQRSTNSTYLTLPFGVRANKVYTVTLTSDTSLTAPFDVYCNITNSSTGQEYFATVTENVTANVPFSFTGIFPDNNRTYLRSNSFSGGLSSNVTVSGTISVEAEDINADDLSEDLLIDMGAGSSIFALNKGSKNILNDVALKRANSTNLNVLTVAHISDTHGNDTNVERYNEWCAKYSDIIDQKINTGDVMETAYNLGTFDDSLFEDTIITIGNHDTADYNGSFDWDAHQGEDAFDRYIAPLYEGWGVTLASGAATNGYCYFYKDFTSKSIRLIVLDAMASQDATMLTWLDSRLAEAKTAGYAVLIAYHYIPATPSSGLTFFDTHFTSKYEVEGTVNHSTLVGKVATWIAGGGKFIAWMVGHVHRDYSGYIQTTSGSTTVKQIVLCAATGSNSASNQDMARVVGEKSQDLFNVYGFDTTSKLIKIMRVGCDYDVWGRHKVTECIRYDTAEIVDSEDIYAKIDGKQDTLVSGTNIKTINNESLLGSGNITIQGGSGGSSVQSDWNESDSSSDAYIKNKPSLATVATSGSYSDLSNKPTIPDAQIQSDWNQSSSSAKDYIKNKPTIDSTPTSASTNLVTSGGVYTALSGKQNTLTFDDSPTSSSNNPVKSGGVYTALEGKQATLVGSGTGQNIKTVNNNSLVGSGNVSVGTVTGVKMNSGSAISPTNGVVDLGTVITSETSLSMGSTSGSGNAVTDISVSGHQITLTKGSTFLTSHQDISGKMNKRTVVTSGSALTADTYLELGTTDTVAPTLPATYTDADEFIFSFTCDTAACSVTLPTGVVLADNCDNFSEVAAGVFFQVSIMNDVAAYLCVTPTS